MDFVFIYLFIICLLYLFFAILFPFQFNSNTFPANVLHPLLPFQKNTKIPNQTLQQHLEYISIYIYVYSRGSSHDLREQSPDGTLRRQRFDSNSLSTL